MPTHYRSSFWIIIATVLLLPIFFIPGGALDFLNAKAFLIVLGTVAAGFCFIYRVWKERQLMMPKHYILSAVAFLPVVYLLSALLATPSSLSLLGYNMEVGTFGSILLGAALLGLSAVIFSDPARTLQGVMAFFGSLSVLALFMIVKILSHGNWFVWGNFAGNMGNPLGAWTDLAVVFGLLAVLAILALGMLPMKGMFKALLSITAVLSTALLVVINFQPAFLLTFIASVLLFFYFAKIEHLFHGKSEGEKTVWFSKRTALPLILGVISLLFFINPNYSTDPVTKETKNLGSAVSGSFGVSNTDVHPTLATTLGISKAVLSQSALLGSGPNTFSQDWLFYKPSEVNSTVFWSAEFPFGAGFFATQISSIGIVGTLAWLAFLVLLLSLALKVITNIPESRAARFSLVSTLTISLFLWTASFVYMPSAAVLMLAFIFTGLLIATASATGLIPSYVVSLRDSSARFISSLVMIAAVIGLGFLGQAELEKVVGAYHYQRASALANVEGTEIAAIEGELTKAVTYAPIDVYFLALSNLNFSKAQIIASSATGTPEEIQPVFENAIATSIDAARAAINVNPANYANWSALGSLYSSLVAKPLAVEGSYENSQYAFNEAYKRNPGSPGLLLSLAQLEINKENFDNARVYIRNSIALKQDYAEAYLLLARLEASQNKLPEAIASAETLVSLTPGNAGVVFELGLLKYAAADFEGALTAFEKALEISPDYANAKYYRALTLAKLGDTEEALVVLKALQAANPDNADLQKAITDVSAPKKK